MLRTVVRTAAAAALAAGGIAAAGVVPAHAADTCRDINKTYTVSRYQQDFFGNWNYQSQAYKVQFIQRACWNGSTVKFITGPDYRVYPTDATFPAVNVTQCTYTGASPINVASTSVRATCQTTITNRARVGRFLYRADGATSTSSDFVLLANQSASRSYTLLVDRNGCVNISGVGRGSACQ